MLLAGCAATPATPDATALFADSLFTPLTEPPRSDQVFALSPAMRDYLRDRIHPRVRAAGSRRGLHEALRDDLTVEYDSESTRTAAQAFATRAGNCLSLVILTAAFARELDIPLRYQSVYGYDTWTRVNGIAFLSGHVNLVLGHGGIAYDSWGRPVETDSLTIDFIETAGMRRHFVREIPESTVIAMFMNNRAAEILADGDVNAAYWWAREALRSSPGFVAAANTLGVIYRRHGNPRQAERALRYARGREPDNTSVLTNLAAALDDQGRIVDAKQVRARLRHIEEHPPFHFLDLGMAAMERGEYRKAVALFEKEQRRMPYDDEVHFALALANLNLGELRQARRELTAALEYSTTRDRRGMYAAKLEKLKAATPN
jgi:Tfp pilus assembly protein PilF